MQDTTRIELRCFYRLESRRKLRAKLGRIGQGRKRREVERFLGRAIGEANGAKIEHETTDENDA